MYNGSARQSTFHLHHRSYGSGSGVIIAFHGFGEDAGRYEIFSDRPGNAFTIHSFDLPYHGRDSGRKEQVVITPDHLRSFFTGFFTAHSVHTFTLIGYSIGAKFALNLIQLFPGKIDKVILIAPDGLRINFWYRLATGTILTRALFKWVIYHPAFFFRLAGWLEATRLVHGSVVRFAKSQMGDQEKREQVYYSWTSFRRLNLDLSKLSKCLSEYHIPVDILLGDKDRIIRFKDLKPLLRSLPAPNVIRLPVGHQRLVEEAALYYAGGEMLF